MLKSFFRHWHYGIKAKVIDNALVAHIDTAVEPVFIRFDLARLQSTLIDVSAKSGDYELVLAGIGAPAASTVLAKFEVRDAAEEAAACLRCALLKGNRTSRFWAAFKIVMGIAFALLVLTLIAGLLELFYAGNGGNQASSASMVDSLTQSTNQALGSLGMEGEAPAAPHDPTEPQSADEFLNGK
jgi:hypothetical protein